jgi:two-component system, OmpR family, sensor histidine kinase BaeS
MPLEARVSTPVVWLLAAVLVAIGGFIVIRVHHAVRSGEQRLLERVALVAAASGAPLPHVAGVDLAVVGAGGHVLSGRLPRALAGRELELELGGRAGASHVFRQGGTTVALVGVRRAGRDVVVVASSTLPEADQRRLLAIEAEGIIPIGLIALGLAVLGLERAARRHRRRLERLGQVARRLDRGELEARTGEHDGDELGGVGVQLDVLADRLQMLERTRGTTLSQVSHDLRSPLALIRAYAWALRKSEGSPARSDRLQTIEDEAQRVSALVDELLLLGRRSAASPMHGSADSADIAALTERVVAQRIAHARDRGLSLELESSAGRALVAIRAGGVERIVGNLIDNALRHAASRVIVRIEIDATRIVLSCEDDGDGIPPDDIAHLFEPFWHGAAGHGGSGLGLAIARELASACGGSIQAENLPGGGASLIVRLPRADARVAVV